MAHANAALTPRARLRLARLIVEQGWPPARAAECYDVSWRTAAKWARRYRDEGLAGVADRSSRPRTQPNRTRLHWSARSCTCGAGADADQSRSATSSAWPPQRCTAVLVRCRLNRLGHLDRITGEAVRRYEHAAPGDLLHVDVKKLGNVPDGGGWRYLGR